MGRMTWVAAFVAATLVASPAFAQEQNNTKESDATIAAGQAAIQSGDALPGGHILGDWGGLRTDLADKGISIAAGYVSETASVVSGGQEKGTAYADQLKLQADVNLQTLAHLKGWSAHLLLVSRHGVSASAKYLGDDLSAVQEIYGGTSNADIHLAHLYLQHIASNGTLTLDEKIGRIPVDEDFNASPLYCGFVSLGICPQPRGQSIDQSFSVNPSATWGGRIKASTRNWYVSAGAYQVRPHYGGPYGFDWGWSNTIGTEIPVEAGWTPRFGPDQLPGHYKIGLTYDTSDRPDLRAGYPDHHHSLSFYASVDQMLVRTGKNGTDGVMVMAGWTHANRHTAIFRDYAYAGVVARGIVPGRPADSIEALVAHGWISNALTRSQEQAQATGETLPTGFPPAPGTFNGPATAPGIQTSTTSYELGYAISLASGFTVTPDMQYVVRPGATRAVRNALVVGGRVQIDL